MHRPLLIAALVLSLVTLPLAAQRGGGHGGGGGHGFGGGFGGRGGFGGGHISGGRAFSGMRSGAGLSARSFGRSQSFNRSFSRGLNRGLNRSRNGARNSLRNGLRNRLGAYGYGCSFYGCGWGYGGYGYPYLGGGIDPYWWWDDDSSSDQDQQDPAANDVQQSVGNQDLYARATPAPAPRRDKQATEIVAATVLVFRDQHKQEVQNYAIVGQTLWNFAPGRTEKIPLSDLDLPATTKANDERGVDFRLPGAA